MGVTEIDEVMKVDGMNGGEVVRTDVRGYMEEFGRGEIGR